MQNKRGLNRTQYQDGRIKPNCSNQNITYKWFKLDRLI